jgi:hypothetical protein
MNFPVSILKNIYRRAKWYTLYLRSFGKINQSLVINPSDIQYGQLPESQFSPKRFLGGYRDGDWDLQVLAIEDHPLYISYKQHFLDGQAWESTPFYQAALESIRQNRPFRGEYKDTEALNRRFNKCDQLYASIAEDGYKSNHQLYAEGRISNILDLMDEITINLDRDGNFILNDGWHRFATARLLGISQITTRLCAIHPSAKPIIKRKG